MPESDRPRASAGGARDRSFEETYRELETVVSQLERGGLDLDTALALYERGTALVGTCEQILDSAELRVTRLAPESAGAVVDAAPEPSDDSSS